MIKDAFPYDTRAVLVAAGKGLSLKKIFASSLYLLVGYILYVIFTWAAFLIDGGSFNYLWHFYGLFPVTWFSFSSTSAHLLFLVGIISAGFCLSLAIMAPSVITFEEMRGNFFFSSANSIRFAFRRIPTLFFGFLSLAAFVGFIYLLILLTGLVGRIPFLGELAIGLFYLVPIFLTLVFTVFIVFISVVAVILLPVILAAQKKKEVFDSLLQLFSVIIREPLRFFWYLAVSAGLAKAASFIFAYLFYRTIQFSHLALSQGGGQRIKNAFNAALNVLPLDSPLVNFVTNIFPGINFGFHLRSWGYGGQTMSVGAVLLSISFFILFVIIVGYMISVLATGLARGYAVIRKAKDDYLIADDESLELLAGNAKPSFKSVPPSSN